MCESIAQGGKRCDQASRFHTAKASLQHKISRQIREGKEEKAEENKERLELLVTAEKKYGPHVSIMNFPLDAPTSKLINKLNDSGLDPIIVGGSVRDLINGSSSKDIDIEVYGDTIDGIAKTLRKNGYQVDEVGKSFGVLKVGQKDGLDVDISVPRRDSLVGEGHRGFEVDMDSSLGFTEASQRRDYTINAMGYSPVYKVAIDPYNGLQDLKENRLRHVSEAFSEDPLRVLRGFQFASRFNMEMHPDTVELSKSLLHRAPELSSERLVGEWEKFYSKGTNPEKALAVLKQTGWDKTVPHLPAYNSPAVALTAQKAVTASHKYSKDTESRVRLVSAAMASHMEKGHAAEFIRATVNGKDNQRTAIALSAKVDVSSDTEARYFARSLAEKKTNITEYVLVRESRGEDMSELKERAKRLRILNAPKPALIMGRDIMAVTDTKPGPWMGKLTKDALDAQEQGVFFTKKDALKWMKKEISARGLK